jgi:ASC-1-like (ASCH) protein
MSKTWILRFASYKQPDDIFELVVNGKKTIETRPATKDFQVGDKLVLVSIQSNKHVKKQASFVHRYKSPEDMVLSENTEFIFPGIGSSNNLLKFYDEAKIKWGKKYKDDLEKYGIVALGLK